MAFEGHLKAQQVRSCSTSALKKGFLPVCCAEPCPHAALFCVLPLPSTHTSSRGMATSCRSCCRGGRDTRTAPSWATRPWQWESLTWLRYSVLGAGGCPTWPPVPALGRELGWQAGSHCCDSSGLLAGCNIESVGCQLPLCHPIRELVCLSV